MCRIVYIVLVLAALSGISANGLRGRPAKMHKNASATSISHSLHKKTPRATPQEVGRAAGLKIRRNLAHRPRAAASLHSPSRIKHLSPRQDRERQTEQLAIIPTTSKVVTLRRTRLAPTPPLRGSYLSLERQNEKLEAEGLERIEDEADLSGRIANNLLVPVPASAALAVNGNLPETHRYCRPWTARFLTDLARIHAAQFHRPLEVSSAVRTVEYQKRLLEINGNAAPAEGEIVSPHLTGATIDIAKQGLSGQELGWMRRWLLPLEATGQIDVEEEFQQACFHITVYKTYLPLKPAGRATGTAKAQPKTTTNPSDQHRLRQSVPPPEKPPVAYEPASQGL
jgi:hypothetical protein